MHDLTATAGKKSCSRKLPDVKPYRRFEGAIHKYADEPSVNVDRRTLARSSFLIARSDA
jgi:hypothetical protein